MPLGRAARLARATLFLLIAVAFALPAQTADARIRTQREELDRIRRERADLERRMANLQGSVHDLRDEVANLDRQRVATELVLKTLDRQLAAQAKAFETEGGFTERLYRVRSEKRVSRPSSTRSTKSTSSTND